MVARVDSDSVRVKLDGQRVVFGSESLVGFSLAGFGLTSEVDVQIAMGAEDEWGLYTSTECKRKG